MREGVDFDTLLEARIEQGVNRALARIEEARWPKWMNATRAAAYLDISRKSLENARRAGKVVGHRIDGHGFTYAKAELDAFANAGKRDATYPVTTQRRDV
jgi:hypothetical protein